MDDFHVYPYPSKRFLNYSLNGMVATSNHLAAQAGLEILKKGGNAVDAAVATAAALTVLEPQANGVGGDAFAIVHFKGKMHGLNSSGPAPDLISAQELRDKGLKEMPKYGFTPVTVPGTPAAWAGLIWKFGNLSLLENLTPAIRYASEGQAVSYAFTKAVKRLLGLLQKEVGLENEFAHYVDTFTANGVPLESGQKLVNLGLADTLRLIGESNAAEFYNGILADKIDAFSRKYGGYLRKSDLEKFHPEWIDPVSVNYRGYDVWELPPNGQGIVALMALNILKGFEPMKFNDIQSVHRQIEAIKLAFADGKEYITDGRCMRVTVEQLLSEAYGEDRRKLITDHAITPKPGSFQNSGTVYLCTADNEGNMVSYIQSNYMGFGSGLVVPGTGIALHNRGNSFNLVDGTANVLAPGKRPYHTIIPGFLTKDGAAVGPFGVMGGFMQPQAHVQVLTSYIDMGLNPQSALDAPRWLWKDGLNIGVEQEFSSHLIDGLTARGHAINIDMDKAAYGKGQIIFRRPDGTYMGATEPRSEGAVATW